MRADVKYDHS